MNGLGEFAEKYDSFYNKYCYLEDGCASKRASKENIFRRGIVKMNSMIMVLKEQISSLYLIKRLSIYQVKSTNNNNYLGHLLGTFESTNTNEYLLVCFWA